MVTVIQIENNEPTYWKTAKTLRALKEEFFERDKDDMRILGAINSTDFSGVAVKFEILDGVWVIFD